jgi:hypothetical protein
MIGDEIVVGRLSQAGLRRGREKGSFEVAEGG